VTATLQGTPSKGHTVANLASNVLTF